LVFHSGEFIYPTVLSLFTNSRQAQQWISRNGFDHLVIQKSKTDAIILSYEQYSILSYFTSTALLMTCFGMLVIPFVFVNIRNRQESNSKLTLVSKIQFAFIGLIIVTLIGFSSVSSSLFSDQYHSYAVTQIAQKEASILEEIKQNDRSFKLQLLPKNSELLNYQLRKWASIFSSDINLFSVEGRLIGTSRNKIYSQGLLSEQMNPNAFEGLHYQNQGEFIQRENIGSLNYLSGYTPIFNHDKQLLGYLNVLHFNQQNMFDEQLKHFFVNILNVFMLLLVLSIVAAYTASSWITKPLIALRRSFSSMQLGKTNKRIHYIGDDEIGSLVTEYNQKLTELEETAKKLAQSERETAWREMAKQVAHEIKNPLTPMKLSIQHLQRVFDPTDPHIIEKINKATQSVIDQIDALTAIANEFSNFAKLPTAVMDDIDLAELVQSTISLFEANESCTITLSHDATENYHVIADKDMMLRVLNNLISNGIQAVAIDSSTNIFIELSSNDTEVVLRVKDNGKGISVDQLETIFEPYFTTKSTGTGLGLAMVKQIVELHHGTITVESSSSSGTCMRLVLPR
jgi:signal transduction histidine kinase